MKNKTKRALTGSVISVLVCTAMLVGTTFAWFTDSVSTGKNTITAGSLTVDLIDEEGNSLEGKTLNWSVADGRAQEEILWEPGAVYVTEGFRVKNTGNLALKYKLTVDGAAGDDKLLEAIELSVVKEAGKEGEGAKTGRAGQYASTSEKAGHFNLFNGIFDSCISPFDDETEWKEFLHRHCKTGHGQWRICRSI